MQAIASVDYLVEAAGIETCVALMETQQFQLLRSTAGGVRVECSDEGMQRHAGVFILPATLVAWPVGRAPLAVRSPLPRWSPCAGLEGHGRRQ